MSRIDFISAGAGSGKTYRLTTTLADALESGEARAHAVLATTFTVKAAAELRERARAWLLDKGRLDLATSIGQAKLGTVNSVCGQLLERFCFEMGISPDQTVLGEAQAARLLKLSLAESLDRDGQTELTGLSSKFGIEHDDWSKAVSQVVNAAINNDIKPDALRGMGGRNADLMLANWPKPSDNINRTPELVSVLGEAESVVSQAIATLQATGAKVSDVMTKGRNEIQRLRRVFDQGRWTWLDWMAAANIDAGAKMRDVVEKIAAVAMTYDALPQFHQDVRHYLTVIFSLAADALLTYADNKRAIGAVDFADQEVLLLRAIRDSQAVRDALSEELDLIIVDEFQDTSPLQLALFVELAKLAKKSVWVGDPKQAIYGFRGSDTSLITGVLSAIESWGGRIAEPLTKSRRSTPALVELANSIFVPAFRDELAPDSVRLEAVRSDIPSQPALFNWNFESGKTETDYLGLGPAIRAFLESGFVVDDKRSNLRRPVRPGDIAILCRRNDQIERAVAALARWSIPSASPRSGLLRTPESLYVLACLRRIANAGDTVATALILTLADGIPVADWFADRIDYLSDANARASQWKLTGEAPHPLLSRLESLRPTLLALTPSEALREATAESQVTRLVNQWATSPHEAKTRIANVEALVELGKAYETECTAAKRPATVAGLLQWLKALADDENDQRAATKGDAVSVITHHGAKGLEWPVVILTSLDTVSRTALWDVRARTDGVFNAEYPLDNRFIHFWPKTWGRRKLPQAAMNAEASELGVAMARNARSENSRLLYVSMTRARDANVLVSTTKKTKWEWIEEVGATNLLFGETGQITLDNGLVIHRSSQTWTGNECGAVPEKAAPNVGRWFVQNKRIDAASLWFRPSDACAGDFAVSDVAPIGTRIALTSKADMTTIGTALHLCIARSAVAKRVDADEVASILANWNVSQALDKEAVVSQIEAFFAWIEHKWPSRPILVEIPLEASLASGNRLRGRIDFLVDAGDGWIIIDHKSNPGGLARDADLVKSHGAQLASYEEALVSATGRPVKESWLYMPVGARALRVTAETVPTTGR